MSAYTGDDRRKKKIKRWSGRYDPETGKKTYETWEGLCDECHKTFDRHTEDQRFCSAKCRIVRWKREHPRVKRDAVDKVGDR